MFFYSMAYSRQGRLASPPPRAGKSLHGGFFLSAASFSSLLRKEGPETAPYMMEDGTCPSFPRKNGELAFHAGGFSPGRVLFPTWGAGRSRRSFHFRQRAAGFVLVKTNAAIIHDL
jgi:hypothetical protein